MKMKNLNQIVNSFILNIESYQLQNCAEKEPVRFIQQHILNSSF